MSTTAKTVSTDVLTAITVSLAALCSAGVKLGHFGTTDFLTIGEEIASSLLTQATSAEAPAAPAATAPAAPASEPQS